MTTPRTPLATSASIGPRCWPTAVLFLPAAPAGPARSRHERGHGDRARGAVLPPLPSGGQTEVEYGSGNAPPNLAREASVRSRSRRRGSGTADDDIRSGILWRHRSPGVADTRLVPATPSPLPRGGIGSTPAPDYVPSLPVPPNKPLTLPASLCSYIPRRCLPSLGALMRPRLRVLGRVHRLSRFYTLFEGSSLSICSRCLS